MKKPPKRMPSDPIRFAARVLEIATGSSTPAPKRKATPKRQVKPRKAG